ncbi:MAG: hypothetical protein HRU77_13800 [Gammaproteobacteria bacterium]|nr:MAG: hypothetical protein HRU77_13800 [Gammaproteobacteria bacterium]
MKNITAIARLFKHGDRYFTIIHETNAMIDPVTKHVEKITKAARETPLDVAQHPRPLEQFAY